MNMQHAKNYHLIYSAFSTACQRTALRLYNNNVRCGRLGHPIQGPNVYQPLAVHISVCAGREGQRKDKTKVTSDYM